ncbi:hypothetical protein QFZ81_003989 [Paenibacillus sp. V4I9]|uniref:hypothetical protein n=1 Tax=Paenibacillus sp. V4I9 TaxID=3042308 RepID=UPI0027892E73|nr:hypothetical protein [Paenibacillus sp. V4I9]MDQ0888901.1 hypothetical protein [Paenibacillus sp. V4I9]
MRNFTLIILLIIISTVLSVGCQKSEDVNNDKLIVLKLVSSENKFDVFKEVTDNTTVSKVKSMITNGDWKKDFKHTDIYKSPNYKFYFQRTDGGDAKPVVYEVFYTDGNARIFFGDIPSYKQLSKDDSEKLIGILQ